METKFNFDNHDLERIVYVRPIELNDLPGEVQEQVGETEGPLFAVCNAEGERLALVRDREMAFVLARENDFAPVNVH